MKPTQTPPAQQPPQRGNLAADAKKEKPWKFCLYDIFRGPYVENTGGKIKSDMTPYVFPAADKVNPVGDAQYDIPKPGK